MSVCVSALLCAHTCFAWCVFAHLIQMLASSSIPNDLLWCEFFQKAYFDCLSLTWKPFLSLGEVGFPSHSLMVFIICVVIVCLLILVDITGLYESVSILFASLFPGMAKYCSTVSAQLLFNCNADVCVMSTTASS